MSLYSVITASLRSAHSVVSVLTTAHTHTRLQAQQTPEQTQVAYFLSVFPHSVLMALLLFADTRKHSTHTNAHEEFNKAWDLLYYFFYALLIYSLHCQKIVEIKEPKVAPWNFLYCEQTSDLALCCPCDISCFTNWLIHWQISSCEINNVRLPLLQLLLLLLFC